MENLNQDKSDRIWITWETQLRNQELSRAFGCQYACLDYSSEFIFVRYLKSLSQTLSALRRGAYALVFAQCPSLILALWVVLLRPIFKYRLVIDAHNAALEYAESSNVIVRLLGRVILRKADFVIVTNSNLAQLVCDLGGEPLVLRDCLPRIAQQSLPSRFSILPRPLITLISTFAVDEPIELFIQGSLEASQPFSLVVTGKRSKAEKLLRYESERLLFSGFLDRQDYEGLIGNSDLLVDLTTREDCLVCGAYEALAVRSPMLLSDTQALREVFAKGFMFAPNTKEGFQEAIDAFLENPNKCSGEIDLGIAEFKSQWGGQFAIVTAKIDALLAA